MEAIATADKTNNNVNECEEVEADSVRIEPMDNHNGRADIERDINGQDASNGIQVQPASHPGQQPSKKASVYGLSKAGKIARETTEYSIEEDDEGLFVIICNTAFNYTYNGIDLSKQKMNYTEDIERIKEVFNLHGNPRNLLMPRGEMGLSRADKWGTADTVFDKFMTEVVLKEREVKPKFLMFFLLSHGYEKNAEFLLAENKSFNKEPCCTGKHRQVGDCYSRDIVKDVISKIQKSPTFSNVPKIFVIQTCRDILDQVPKMSKSLPARPPDEPDITQADKYIPRGSDTLVLYSCIETHKSWIEKSAGPFLVRNLCEAIDGVRISVGKSVQMVSDLHQSLLGGVQADQSMKDKMDELNDYRKKRGWDNLLFCPEAFTDSWLTSVCQKTMANITTFLKKTETKSECVDFPSLYAVEQRPEISSTLRYKLSMIKILRTQWLGLYEDSQDMVANEAVNTL